MYRLHENYYNTCHMIFSHPTTSRFSKPSAFYTEKVYAAEKVKGVHASDLGQRPSFPRTPVDTAVKKSESNLYSQHLLQGSSNRAGTATTSSLRSSLFGSARDYLGSSSGVGQASSVKNDSSTSARTGTTSRSGIHSSLQQQKSSSPTTSAFDLKSSEGRLTTADKMSNYSADIRRRQIDSKYPTLLSHDGRPNARGIYCDRF